MKREKALKELARQLIEFKRPVEYIINHCSFTPPEMNIGAKEIKRWHVVDNGWRDIAYAIIVRRNGEIEFGRDLNKNHSVVDDIGAHTLGHNHNSIGICWIGGMCEDVADSACDNRTIEQKVSILAINGLFTDHIKNVKIRGHRDFNKHKQCPCFDAKLEYSIFKYQ